jgi:metal-responsive CopG/Arc/MetJ family transcriptional regulator
MRTTITLDHDLVERLLGVTQSKNKAAAVREAIEGFLREAKLARIRASRGRLEFDLSAKDLRPHER